MKVRNIFGYDEIPVILIFMLILLSGSIFQVFLFTPTWLFAFVIVVISIFKNRLLNKELLLKLLFIYLLLEIVIYLNFLLSISNDLYDYNLLSLQLLLAILIFFYFKQRRIDPVKYLEKVIVFICKISLLGLIISLFDLGWIWSNGGFSVKTVLYIFYYKFPIIDIGPLTIYRNQGLFWEPGILMIYANILLFLSLFISYNKKKVILSSITILTTLSTTGLFIMAMQFLFLLLLNWNKGNLKFFHKFSAILVLIVVFSVSVISFKEKKQESYEVNLSSYNLRLLDFVTGYKITKEHPIFGIGLNSKVYNEQKYKHIPSILTEITETIENRGSSNSFISIFYNWGLIIGILIVYYLYKQTIIYKNKVLFFFIIILGLSNEPIFATPFFLLILVSGLWSYFGKIKYI